MNFSRILFKAIANFRDSHHLASKHWQGYKKALPPLPPDLFQVVLGMVLCDASVFKQSIDAGVKFEQGYKQQAFILHVFNLLETYRFMLVLGVRIEPAHSARAGKIKSYWFKTFSHPSFTAIWNLLYVNGVKIVQPGLILNHLTEVGFAYLVMCDGSLSGNSLTLHTQGFTRSENETFSNELNTKFGLSSKVIFHKIKYWVVVFPSSDAAKLRAILAPHIIPSMQYKLP